MRGASATRLVVAGAAVRGTGELPLDAGLRTRPLEEALAAVVGGTASSDVGSCAAVDLATELARLVEARPVTSLTAATGPFAPLRRGVLPLEAPLETYGLSLRLEAESLLRLAPSFSSTPSLASSSFARRFLSASRWAAC